MAYVSEVKNENIAWFDWKSFPPSVIKLSIKLWEGGIKLVY